MFLQTRIAITKVDAIGVDVVIIGIRQVRA
jgi:hypothetical protein